MPVVSVEMLNIPTNKYLRSVGFYNAPYLSTIIIFHGCFISLSLV